MTATAYYVSPTGSNSNPGTLNAPFATFQKAQQAMQNSSIKTTYILAGNYSPAGNANSPDGSGVLNLTSADSGETWSYYPPDGYGSAQISGGGTISTFMSINGATGVTVNGLNISNFTSVGIQVTNGSSNANIINNTIHDMPQYGIIMDDQGAAVNNTTVSNNYLYNIGSNGISIYSLYNNGTNNNTISNNIIDNAATDVLGGGNPYSDAASIYAQDLNGDKSTGNTITNNYIGSSDGVAIYLDDGASNYTVTGNILDPGTTAFALVQLHGGSNNVFSGNIGDVSTGLLDGFVFYQQSDDSAGATAMTGNLWENNLLVGDIASGGGNGYTGSLSPPNPLTIADNDYWNLGSGGKLVSTGNGGAGSDSDPTYKNPDFTSGSYGSSYTIASSSPIFGSPVDFPGVAGGWGPPTSGTSPPPPPPPPPSSPPPPPPPPPSATDLYEFYFVYNDNSYYFGWAADNGTYGYYVGETITTNNTYGGYYVIYGSEGATTDAVGSVYTKDYVDQTNGGKDYLSESYLNGGAPDGSSGIGSEFDYTDGANGLQAFGLGGEYEAMQGINLAPVTPTFTAPSSLTVSAGQSIPLGIVINPVPSSGTISVTISGVPKFESITAADGTTATITKQSTTYTYEFSNLPSDDLDNGLILTSTYKGTKHPKDTLTITVSDTADGQTDTASAQTIKVTDPPAGSTSSTQATGSGQQTPDLALLCQYTAAGFATTPDPGAGSPVTYATAQDTSGAPNLLTNPH
jgi:hypothetical protein